MKKTTTPLFFLISFRVFLICLFVTSLKLMFFDTKRVELFFYKLVKISGKTGAEEKEVLEHFSVPRGT